MRTTVITAVLLAACLPLTACGSSVDADPGPAKTVSSAATPDDTAAPPAETDLALGKTAHTVGLAGLGALDITPTTVVYADAASGSTPENDVFAVVSVKGRATSAAAAKQGQWQWVTPDGLAINKGNEQAAYVTLQTFQGGGDVQPGTFQWDTATFDLETEQRGGTLLYVDGNGATTRWIVPAANSGPQIAEMKKELKS